MAAPGIRVDRMARRWSLIPVKSFPIPLPAAARFLAIGMMLLLSCSALFALERTNTVFKVFQFPADKIPRIDGDTNDWNLVPESYVIGGDQLTDDSGKHKSSDACAPKVRVKVGWVKGLNRLYFLYEADDDYWDFALPGLHNDTFELVVNADLSGGPLIEKFHPARAVLGQWETYFQLQGVHAQNYHIFTPAAGKDFFRSARSRLSAEAYSALLGAIKRLNAHTATVPDVLAEARALLGPATDLYAQFEQLLLSSAV